MSTYSSGSKTLPSQSSQKKEGNAEKGFPKLIVSYLLIAFYKTQQRCVLIHLTQKLSHTAKTNNSTAFNNLTLILKKRKEKK